MLTTLNISTQNKKKNDTINPSHFFSFFLFFLRIFLRGGFYWVDLLYWQPCLKRKGEGEGRASGQMEYMVTFFYGTFILIIHSTYIIHNFW